MVLEELGDYLEAQGIGVVGETIFLSAIHDTATPETAIGLFEYAGRPPFYVHDQALPCLEAPSVQVLCRAPHYADARSLAEAVYQTLEAVRNTTLSGVHYVSITAHHPPFSLGPDANERAQVVINVSVLKEVSS
jgi:hypothetical protein